MKPNSKSEPQEGQRLQKVLANIGLGSRREIERWIAAGRVSVNGKVSVLGDRVTDEDKIYVDKRPVRNVNNRDTRRKVIVYNKPEGEVVTRDDPEGRPTVFKSLPKLKDGRWIAVGRLDINSSGLMIFTNDGELANRLMHPSQQVEREYSVRVMGHVSQQMVETLVSGVELEDGPARFEDVVESGGEGLNRWFHVVIMEGRNREVRRMWDAVGAKVNRLKRVRFGPVFLGSLPIGRSRDLEYQELEDLLRASTPEAKPGPDTRKVTSKPNKPVRKDSASNKPRSSDAPVKDKAHSPYTGKEKGRGRKK